MDPMLQYCERAGRPGLLAEPFNTATNLAYLLAALAAWRLARRLGAATPGVRLLIGLATAVGVGSTLFHMTAAFWALVLDVGPIWLFQLVFLWLYMRRAMGLGVEVASAGMAAYLAACGLTLFDRHLINGSIIYLPTLIVLLGLGVDHFRTRRPGRGLLLAGSAVLALGLTFRTVDRLACPYVPIGTHFLWHLSTGLLLYLALRALIFLEAARSPSRPPAPVGD